MKLIFIALFGATVNGEYKLMINCCLLKKVDSKLFTGTKKSLAYFSNTSKALGSGRFRGHFLKKKHSAQQYDSGGKEELQWSDWMPWTMCTRTCGGGRRYRYRERDNGGDIDSETERCNVEMCATWGDWADWSDCSVECGNGVKFRSRRCQLDPSISATSTVDWSECDGGFPRQEMKCNTQPCQDHMIFWRNQISYGYYVAIDSSRLSGKGSTFQQCADYCYSMKGWGSTNRNLPAIAI